MKLLISITRYWPTTGGAEVHTRELLRALRGNVTPTVVAHWAENRTDWLLGTTLLGDRRPREYTDEGRLVHLIGTTYSDRLKILPLVAAYYPLMGWAAPGLADRLFPQLLATGEQDLVHNVRVGREPLTLASQALARHLGVPFVFTPNHHPRWVGWRYRVFHDVYRSADALVALTEHERHELIRLGAQPSRVHVTGIGPVLAQSASPQRARDKFGLHGRFILFVGQKYPYKGLGALIRAAPLVWQKHPDAEFVFVGPRTPHSELLLRDVTDPRIRDIDKVDLQDKTDLFRAAEVICVPSSQESFGGVLVEGWASGKPVVAGPAPAAGDIIDEGIDGFFLSHQSPSLIAESLVKLLDDPYRAAAMGAAGERKVAERYSWEQLAERTVALYRSLL